VAAVVFVAVVAAFAVFALLPKGHPAGPAERQPTAGAAGGTGAESGVVSTATAGSASAPAAGVPLTAAPAGVVWRLVDGAALPFSAADGPRSTAGGVASGFGHSPAGALLACVQTTFRIGNIDPAAQAGVVRAMVIGAGQPGLLASRPAAALAVRPQMAGFRYLSYTPGEAVISLAWRVTDVAGGTARFLDVGELDMVWSDGDWRLVEDGGQPPLPTTLDAGLTGFVPFAGV
jgi:hypothetical protein